MCSICTCKEFNMNNNHRPTIHLPHLPQTYLDNTDTEKQKATKELVDAIGTSQDVLIRVSTAFPFTLFPDTITIDRNKLTITHRDFFKAGATISINIEDILNVVANVGPVLGSVRISSRFFDRDKPYVVNNLFRKDTLRIKRILQGCIIAKQRGIDCSALTTTELAKLLDELGKVATPEKV